MHHCRGWNEAATHQYIYISHFAHCFTFTSRMYICEISAQARPPTGGARWGKRRRRDKAFHRSQHLISGHVWCFLWSAQLSVCLCDQDVCRWRRGTRCSENVPLYGVTKLQSQLPFLRVILFFFSSPHAISSAFNLLQRVMPPFTSIYYVLIVHGHFLLLC